MMLIKFKILIPILFIVFSTGCQSPEIGGVKLKEFNVGGNKVVVGGVARGIGAVGDFKPEAVLEKWNGEASLTVYSEEIGDKTASQAGDKIIWNAESGNQYHFYTKTANDLKNEDGGFEYEIIFKEKPKTNIVELKIETKGLEFYYQPELTQQEIDEGVERPENIIGSYAVYYSKSGNYSAIGDKNYKTGKAFHIYRPKIIDADKKEIWGEMNINNGVLRITIDQKYLDDAVYPVIVDPTFGYTSVGGSNTTGFNGFARAMKISAYTANSGDVITQYSVYSKIASGNTTVAMTAYSFSGGVPASRLAAGTSITINSPTAGWFNSSSVEQSLSNGTEYVVALGNVISANTYLYYDSSSNATSISNTNSGNLEASWTELASASYIYSFYATYTAGEEPPADPTISTPPETRIKNGVIFKNGVIIKH